MTDHDHLKLTALRDQLDSLIDEAARRDLKIRKALTLFCERMSRAGISAGSKWPSVWTQRLGDWIGAHTRTLAAIGRAAAHRSRQCQGRGHQGLPVRAPGRSVTPTLGKASTRSPCWPLSRVRSHKRRASTTGLIL